MIESTLVHGRVNASLVAGLPEGTLHRARLLALIGSPPARPITLITALAGFGKSTLAIQWARAAAHPVIWVSLHSESNSPARFVADLVEALLKGRQIASSGDEAPTLQRAILRIRALAEQSPITLVIDDYHAIENRDVHDMMNALIDNMPSTASIMILSRTLPPLALGRLRVAGQVCELTEIDLRFDQEEVTALAVSEVKGGLTRAQVTRLGERTQGWIAGIRLALLTVQEISGEQIDATINALSSNLWLDHYIVEEVLNALPEHLRQFVLRTSSLGLLNPEFCDAVLGIENSAALIDQLMNRLVFMRHDARVAGTVTYHALFAECVEHIAARTIPPGDLRSDRSRAAAWLEANGRYEEALDHALNVQDWPLARRIVRAICQPFWERDLHHSLLHWLEKLPVEQIRHDHELLYWYIQKLFSVGRFRDGLVQLEFAEPLWQNASDPIKLGFLHSCRAFRASFEGDFGASLTEIYRALRHLPLSQHVTRMRAWTHVCGGEFLRGNDELATQAYRQAESARRFLPAEQRWWTTLTEVMRINQYAVRANLPTAERLYRAALDRLPPQFQEAAGKLRFRLAAIYLEWNELDLAQEEVEQFTQAPKRFPWQNWYLEAWLIAARVALARGRIEEAEQTLNQLFEMMDERGETHTAARARAVQTQLWLSKGETLLAGAWGDGMQFEQGMWAETFGETDPYVVLIQLRVTQQRYGEALSLATTRIAEGQKLKRHAELVSLYVWQMVALRALGRTEEAIEAFRAALRLAIPSRIVQSFVTPGTNLQPFFRAVAPHLTPEEGEYVRMLLSASFPSSDASAIQAAPISTPGLHEPLSLRELEVLGLLGTGLVNREIAEKLFISERTVKKHLANIFAKLDVDNRLAAVVRARELGLLP